MSSIVVRDGNTDRIIIASDGENLLSVLQKNRIDIAAHCGGNGTCGKCLVTIEKDGHKKTALACKTTINGDCTVTVGGTLSGGVIENSAESVNAHGDKTGYGIACDIGTSTVVASLYNMTNGELCDTVSGWNSQITFGADVITRVQYINEHTDGLKLLSDTIRDQIKNFAETLAKNRSIDLSGIKEIHISGNTIMQHIFAGISPRSIAVFPFEPETLFDDDKIYHIPELPDSDIVFTPCVAGYIGGDITAGLSSVSRYNDKCILFTDIGTNGEMAIGTKDGYITCSVATGPAFEGAQLECGMPAQSGAINKIYYKDNKLQYTVTDDTQPVGICGSRVIQLIAILLEKGIITESGRLLSPEETDSQGINLGEDEDGNGIVYITDDEKIYLSAKDVRQIQLAKASVAAGINILLKESNIIPDKVYLAGGFGRYIDIESAVTIGMLPESLKDKITYAGNTSLKGTAQSLMSESFREKTKEISKKCRYIELSLSADFREYYIEQMQFTNGRED